MLLLTTLYPCLPPCAPAYHAVPLLIHAYLALLLLTTMCPSWNALPLLTTLYPCLSRRAIAYRTDAVLLLITLYPCLPHCAPAYHAVPLLNTLYP